MKSFHSEESLHNLLEEKFLAYSKKEFFLETDPIQIPHRFALKEDIEIAGFLAATIAWGQRKTIIGNASKLMALMDEQPFEFITQSSETDWKRFETFVHRTFNGTDCITFVSALKNIYKNGSSLETAFTNGSTMAEKISNFKKTFFTIGHLPRSRKHIADPMSGSSAKRICMYLRWMVRPAAHGTDFGIWTRINTAELYLPLDVHSGNIARKLGILIRKQDDWKAVVELTEALRKFDAADPCKYDYALFGLGAFGKL